jgi:hypothetical protein
MEGSLCLNQSREHHYRTSFTIETFLAASSITSKWWVAIFSLLFFFYPGGLHDLGTFTGFLFFCLGGILAAVTTFVPPFLLIEALALLLRITLRLADLVYRAIINIFGVW